VEDDTMRKLAFACALAAAALFAQGARAESAGDKAQQGANKAAGETRKTGQRWREAGDRAVNGNGSAGSAEQRQKAEEAKSPMNDDAHNRTAQNTRTEKKHPLFDGKHNYDLDGKVQKVSKDSITISREDLPPATLTVSRGTRVQLDGDDVSIERLRPGEDVKASFNLDKEKPEAVEIKAERTDAEKDAHKRTEKNERK
jgi:hypothetical protein